MKMVIIVEGGIVQQVLINQPLPGELDVVVLDYDDDSEDEVVMSRVNLELCPDAVSDAFAAIQMAEGSVVHDGNRGPGGNQND